MKIKKICFSPEVPIHPYWPKSDLAPLRSIRAQFKPKQPHQKALPAHACAVAHFSPWVQISPTGLHWPN